VVEAKSEVVSMLNQTPNSGNVCGRGGVSPWFLDLCTGLRQIASHHGRFTLREITLVYEEWRLLGCYAVWLF
jgi:hypothetical protein